MPNKFGQFDLAMLTSEFFRQPHNAVFLLVDWLEGQPIASKILVASSRSSQHDQVLTALHRAYNTDVELLYLDEIPKTPQLAGFIEQQLRYLDAAIAELKQAFTMSSTS